MILLSIILLTIALLGLVGAIILGIGGTALILVFGDLAICIFIIVAIVKALKKKNKKG